MFKRASLNWLLLGVLGCGGAQAVDPAPEPEPPTCVCDTVCGCQGTQPDRVDIENSREMERLCAAEGVTCECPICQRG